MTKITVSTNEGLVVEQIDLAEYDLTKAIARASVASAVLEAAERAAGIESKTKEEEL